MPLLRMVFLAGVVLLGGVGVFLGVIVMLIGWQAGAISLSYVQDGKDVAETVSRAADGARFWRLFLAMGAAPAVLGLAALIFGVLALRR
jgi:hypothetical protein